MDNCPICGMPLSCIKLVKDDKSGTFLAYHYGTAFEEIKEVTIHSAPALGD